VNLDLIAVIHIKVIDVDHYLFVCLWWRQMVDQLKADEFAKYLGFSEFAARLPRGNKDIYITCDGVGTKLYVANWYKKWDTIGIDLVAMCANDLLACGATPSAFMDYYAVDTLNLDKSKEIIKGIKKGCELAGCELVGGETAQLEGVFGSPQGFDLCGFAIGEVHQRTRIHSKLQTPKAGDYLVGIPSSGLHSNGFTQIKNTLGRAEWMLEPTRIYTKEIISNLARIKRCAHITGGGIVRNLKRILNGRTYHLFNRPFEGIWEIVSSKFDRDEMLNTFNCGWGMILITDTLDLNLEDAEHIGNVI